MDTEEIKALINRLRRSVLIASFIYYRMNDSIISDAEYDRRARKLMELQKQYPDIAEECVYADAFRNFSETTSGFDLPLEDPWVVSRGQYLLKLHYERYTQPFGVGHKDEQQQGE